MERHPTNPNHWIGTFTLPVCCFPFFFFAFLGVGNLGRPLDVIPQVCPPLTCLCAHSLLQFSDRARGYVRPLFEFKVPLPPP